MVQLPAVFSTKPKFMASLVVVDSYLLYCNHLDSYENWSAAWQYNFAAAGWGEPTRGPPAPTLLCPPTPHICSLYAVTVYALIKLILDNGFD